MKKTRQAEPTDRSDHTFFAGTEYAPLSVRGETALAVGDAPPVETALLDTFVTVIKWTFLYIPGRRPSISS